MNLRFWQWEAKKMSYLYRNCSDTPMSIFIPCLIHHKIELLVKSGKPSRQEINKAWEDLFAQYCELTNTPGYQQMLNVSKEIGTLNAKIMSVALCLRVLQYRYSFRAVSTLRNWGYQCKFDINDKESYSKDWNAVQTKSKTADIALKQRIIEYEGLVKSVGNQKLTEEHFTKIFIELAKYMGYRIRPEELSVSEYVAIINKREKEIQAHNELLSQHKY